MNIKKNKINKQIVLLMLVSLVMPFSQGADYRNFYGISWRGSACENIDYAKSMGYDYVNYQYGMEDCANNSNIGFFLETPETKVYPNNIMKIDTLLSYLIGDRDEYNDFFLWKSSSSFPYNLATGWFDNSHKFKPLPDFQRQEIIDRVVDDVMDKIPDMENDGRNFYFAGFSWDVPSLNGDLWSAPKDSGGRQVKISYWTGTESGIRHPGKSYQYSKYSDGQAAFRKKLLDEARERYGTVKTIIEPYMPYEGFVSEIESRSDRDEIKPDMICQEGAETYNFDNTLKFVKDERLFAEGLMSKSKMCSTTPKVYDHDSNLKIMGNAAINSAWFTWFGRFGGTGNMPDYGSIRDVPARLKLIRAMVGWDNLNGATSRTWNSSILRYKSSISYADKYVIYSRHPKNNNLIYAVVLNKDSSYIKLKQGEVVKAIYNTDGLFRKTTRADSDFTISNIVGYPAVDLKSNSNHYKGYIIELKQ